MFLPVQSIKLLDMQLSIAYCSFLLLNSEIFPPAPSSHVLHLRERRGFMSVQNDKENYTSQGKEIRLKKFRRWGVIAENCSHPQASTCGVCGGQIVTETALLRVLLFTPVSIISSSIHTHSFMSPMLWNLSVDSLINNTLQPGGWWNIL